MEFNPPLTEEEILGLLHFHLDAALNTLDHSGATKARLFPHVQRIEQLYLLLSDAGKP